MLGYDSYIDSQIPYVGLIPSYWKVVQNKRVMHKEKRICSSYAGQDILSLTMNGVVIRNLDAGGKMPTTFDGYQFVYPGELLMCLFDIDVTPRCVGRVNNMGLTSPAYSSFVLHENADLGYFYYYYLMLDHTKELLHLAKNLRHSLTEEQLGQIYVPLPPILEQRTIASYLDKKIERIDFLISEAKASIEEYKSWKASIIYEVVTRGLDPDVEMKDSGVEWIGEIPNSWDVLKLKYVIAFIESGVSVNASQSAAEEGKIGVLKTSSVSKYSFRPEENKEVNLDELGRVSCPVRANTIIVSRMNTPELVGACGYVEQDYPNLFLPDRLWQVHFLNSVVVKYIWYYLSSNYIRNYYSSLSSGTSSSMQNISKGQFENARLLLPPPEVQRDIVKFLDKKCATLDSLVAEKESLIADLEAYKKSLIFEVVTGKRRVV